MNLDINFEKENVVFNFRVAIVIRNKDKILVQKDDRVTHVTLPGGRVLLGENTIFTAIREFQEETGISCEFVKALGMIENFFVSSFNGKKYHEILVIQEIRFVNSDLYTLESIPCTEEWHKGHLKFIWMDKEDLINNKFKPEILVKIINDRTFSYFINQ